MSRVKTETEISGKNRYLKYVQFFILCLTFATQNLLTTGATSASMTSIEKAFKITSLHIGLCLTIYNIFFVLTTIPLGYFAKKHKMIYIIIFTLLISIGSVIFIIPSFYIKIPPPVSKNISSFNNSNKTAEQHKYFQINSLILMYVGYAIIGIGSCPLYNVAINQIYDTFENKNTSVHISTYVTFGILGTIFTFVLAKFVLSIPLHPWKNNSHIRPESENWIGAYWILYISASIALVVLFFINLIIFKISPKMKNNDESKISLSNFKQYLTGCLKNYPLMTIILVDSFCSILHSSLADFFLKYIQIQFQISAKDASLIGGLSLTIPMILGLYAASFITKYFLTNRKRMLIFNLTSIIFVIVFLFLSFMYCPVSKFKIEKSDGTNSFNNSTHQGCKCPRNLHLLVKNETITNETPCHFDSIRAVERSEKRFDYESNLTSKFRIIRYEKCKKECKLLTKFIFRSVFIIFFISMAKITTLNLTREYAGPELSNFAVSLRSTFLRIFFILGPLIYGTLFETSCILKAPSISPLETTNCIEYDQNQLMIKVIGLSILIEIIHMFGICISLFYETFIVEKN